MLMALGVVVFNFLLVQIFASTYYIVYFLVLLIYIYLFSFKVNLLYATIIMIFAFALKHYLNEAIYDFYLWIDYSLNFFYIDDTVVYVLSFFHFFVLLLLSPYENLKKMSYN